jgi:hypothetical protein
MYTTIYQCVQMIVDITIRESSYIVIHTVERAYANTHTFVNYNEKDNGIHEWDGGHTTTRQR